CDPPLDLVDALGPRRICGRRFPIAGGRQGRGEHQTKSDTRQRCAHENSLFFSKAHKAPPGRRKPPRGVPRVPLVALKYTRCMACAWKNPGFLQRARVVMRILK